MGNDTKFNAWTLVINSVKTPLGFFTLLALILDAALLGAASATDRVPMWAPFLLLGLLIACVFSIVIIKPHALYHPSDWPTMGKVISVNLIFPIDTISVDLDIEECILEVRDKVGQNKYEGTPNITFGHGGWSLKLMEDIEPSDSVRLELVEASQRKWRVNPFAPYEKEVKVFEIN